MLPAVGKQEVGGTGLKIEVIHSTSSIPKIKSSRDIFLRKFSCFWHLNCTTKSVASENTRPTDPSSVAHTIQLLIY